jgi:SecD/SecF fusion protein
MKQLCRFGLLAAVGLALATAGAGPARLSARGDKKAGTGPEDGEVLTFKVRAATGRNGFDPKKDLQLLAESLKRRIDPNGLYDIVIRPAGEGRVQIVLPAVGTRPKKGEPGTKARALTKQDLLRIKRLISTVGLVEFRVLANSHDDARAIAEAREVISKNKEKLDQLAGRGEPPPPPTVDGTALGTPKVFEVKLARGARSKVTYRWVELGRQERLQLGLDNAAEKDKGRGQAWKVMAEARANGVATPLPSPGDPVGRKLLHGALFYSRECKDRNLPEEDRKAKKYEYFVLARNPEIDPTTGQPTPSVDGSYLLSASSQRAGGRPAVAFTFNAKGGSLLHTLTEKNVPSGKEGEATQVKRHLAIILDGLVVSAPAINSAIGQHGQITGQFTQREVDMFVAILRAGALPFRLEPVPPKEGGTPKKDK